MSKHDIEALSIAAAALVVDEGMDYASAKQRAARQWGGRAELPSSEALEEAVREHIALFCAETQPKELRALRELALPWLDRLKDFRPYLSGAVWRGTATRLSAVHIDLYCDSSKDVELALINAGVTYDAGEETGARASHRREPMTVLTLASRSPALAEPVTVHLLVHADVDERGALKPDAHGRSWRGNAAALEKLMRADGDAALS